MCMRHLPSSADVVPLSSTSQVAFIDTEGTFRPERIHPIAARFNLDAEAVLENVSCLLLLVAENVPLRACADCKGVAHALHCISGCLSNIWAASQRIFGMTLCCATTALPCVPADCACAGVHARAPDG